MIINLHAKTYQTDLKGECFLLEEMKQNQIQVHSPFEMCCCVSPLFWNLLEEKKKERITFKKESKQMFFSLQQM